MPPQPLSRVRSQALVFVGATGVTSARPVLVQLAAQAIATWADIENQFGGMLTTMLGANAGPAAAMFNALLSAAAQMAALRAAATSVLGAASREHELFGVVIDEAARAAGHRNRFAHWCWAHCDELPDALLFVDPEELMEHDMKRGGTEAPFDGHALLGELDRSRILVYRERDLKAAVADLQEASYSVSHLRYLIAVRGVAASPVLDQLYRDLTTRPKIAEALSRIRSRQQSAPTERRGRRRTQRNDE